VSNGRVISEWWIGKYLEGSGRGLILRYYPGIRLEGLRKTTKSFGQDSRFPSRDLSPGPPEYEARVLTIWPQRSVVNGKECGRKLSKLILRYFTITTLIWRKWRVKATRLAVSSQSFDPKISPVLISSDDHSTIFITTVLYFRRLSLILWPFLTKDEVSHP
jgi:hypothetical protein